jgi:hypothetical protein
VRKLSGEQVTMAKLQRLTRVLIPVHEHAVGVLEQQALDPNQTLALQAKCFKNQEVKINPRYTSFLV